MFYRVSFGSLYDLDLEILVIFNSTQLFEINKVFGHFWLRSFVAHCVKKLNLFLNIDLRLFNTFDFKIPWTWHQGQFKERHEV